jgi:hypothetical protein
MTDSDKFNTAITPTVRRAFEAIAAAHREQGNFKECALTFEMLQDSLDAWPGDADIDLLNHDAAITFLLLREAARAWADRKGVAA